MMSLREAKGDIVCISESSFNLLLLVYSIRKLYELSNFFRLTEYSNLNRVHTIPYVAPNI